MKLDDHCVSLNVHSMKRRFFSPTDVPSPVQLRFRTQIKSHKAFSILCSNTAQRSERTCLLRWHRRPARDAHRLLPSVLCIYCDIHTATIGRNSADLLSHSFTRTHQSQLQFGPEFTQARQVASVNLGPLSSEQLSPRCLDHHEAPNAALNFAENFLDPKYRKSNSVQPYAVGVIRAHDIMREFCQKRQHDSGGPPLLPSLHCRTEARGVEPVNALLDFVARRGTATLACRRLGPRSRKQGHRLFPFVFVQPLFQQRRYASHGKVLQQVLLALRGFLLPPGGTATFGRRPRGGYGTSMRIRRRRSRGGHGTAIRIRRRRPEGT